MQKLLILEYFSQIFKDDLKKGKTGPTAKIIFHFTTSDISTSSINIF